MVVLWENHRKTIGKLWFYPLVMTNVAIENDHRNSGFSHEKWWFSIVMLNYQMVNLCVFFVFFPENGLENHSFIVWIPRLFDLSPMISPCFMIFCVESSYGERVDKWLLYHYLMVHPRNRSCEITGLVTTLLNYVDCDEPTHLQSGVKH